MQKKQSPTGANEKRNLPFGDKIKALQSYLDRPFACKLGFHKRRPIDAFRKQHDTCQICFIEEIIMELTE